LPYKDCNSPEAKAAQHRAYIKYKQTVKGKATRARAEAKYKSTHREQVRKRMDQWRLKNLDRLREYDRQRFPIRYAIDPLPWLHRSRKRRAKIKSISLDGSFTKSEVNALLEKQKWRCAYCGISLYFIEQHIDHKTPISRGGSNYIENIAVTCASCNQSKHTKTAEEFMVP
jgi:5-methylcytosine-specific restriction endonuclease McrA